MIAQFLVDNLTQNNLQIATAESCTGGLVAGTITDIPGSSNCFSTGIVTYSNDAKKELINVPQDILDQYGAVSSETALAMAAGVKNLAKADIAISTTGIAGPDGGTEDKPVGLVYIGLVWQGGSIIRKYIFTGERFQVRIKTVEAAIELVEDNWNKIAKTK